MSLLSQNGLVAYYPFNKNADDESINNNHGEIFGATLTSDRFNSDSSAYHFSGLDYIKILDHESLDIPNVTISVWVKFDNTSSIQLIVDKHLGSGALDSYEIWFQNNKFWGAIGNTSGFGPFISAELIPNLSEWYHLVYTYDDLTNTQKLYIDCELVATSEVLISPSTDNEPLLIGASNDQQIPKFFFKGDIDESGLSPILWTT